jgi:hypothetical protein
MLIVEDGSGLSNAESFTSVADAAAYHASFGNTAAWAAIGAEADQEAMLRRATSYMQSRYYGMWAGDALGSTQRLDWPRSSVPTRDGYGAVPSNAVPPEVKNACAELALKAFSGELWPDSTQGVKREKIGPLEVEYDQYSPSTPVFNSIDASLAPLLKMGAQPGINIPRMRT